MTHPGEDRNASRRGMLERVGTGALAVSLLAGPSTATQTQEDRQLRASVEPGEGDSENWTSRDYLTDEFGARIGVENASGRYVTFLVTVFDPNGELIEPRCDAVEMPSSSGFLYQTDPWYPTGILGPFGEWPTGEYRLFATVADSDGAFGTAISDPFTVDPT